MANQRKRGLKLIGTFVQKRQIAAFRQLAKARGLNVSDVLRELIRAKIQGANPGNGVAAQREGETSEAPRSGRASIIIHATIEIC
ncbi:MAG: ribbon-helix-helix protein, CopG family [Limisphaerales bacterium]